MINSTQDSMMCTYVALLYALDGCLAMLHLKEKYNKKCVTTKRSSNTHPPKESKDKTEQLRSQWKATEKLAKHMGKHAIKMRP